LSSPSAADTLAAMAFLLHPQLEGDTIDVLRLPLSIVRLMNDRTWPWLVLVPAREDVTELFELEAEDRRLFVEEMALASTVLRDLFQPHKINVAALGNQVPQLHCHVIVRFHHDPAWPRPVWGIQPPVPYDPHERDTLVGALQDAFARNRPQFDTLVTDRERTDAEEATASGFWTAFGFTDR
jgi:diadenosine tetraphosphate (Ap4A) HIT family hydrolase